MFTYVNFDAIMHFPIFLKKFRIIFQLCEPIRMCFIHGVTFYFSTRLNSFILKFTFPRGRCSSKGKDIIRGGFSFIQMSLIITIRVTMWHNILPPTIEQTEISNMLEIPKNYDCNLKVRNLGFGHKMNSCTCQLQTQCQVKCGLHEGVSQQYNNSMFDLQKELTCQF